MVKLGTDYAWSGCVCVSHGMFYCVTAIVGKRQVVASCGNSSTIVHQYEVFVSMVDIDTGHKCPPIQPYTNTW